LREDNAALRMVPHGLALGLITEQDARPVLRLRSQLEAHSARLSGAEIQWLQHSRRRVEEACAPFGPLHGLDHELAQAIFVAIRYAPYEEQRRIARERLLAAADLQIPDLIDPRRIPGLSSEARDALDRARPKRLREAAALPGVSSEAISILAVYLRRLERLRTVSRGTSD
jgi:tRNA uridine 5-carboxymethylaminomethyl modification enzyme